MACIFFDVSDPFFVGAGLAVKPVGSQRFPRVNEDENKRCKGDGMGGKA
jgi:hypothetical protein